MPTKKLMLSTTDCINLENLYDADGNPVEVALEVLFTGSQRCQIAVSAPRSVGIERIEPPPLKRDRLPDIAGFALGDKVSVGGVVYRLVAEPSHHSGRKRVWLQVK